MMFNARWTIESGAKTIEQPASFIIIQEQLNVFDLVVVLDDAIAGLASFLLLLSFQAVIHLLAVQWWGAKNKHSSKCYVHWLLEWIVELEEWAEIGIEN